MASEPVIEHPSDTDVLALFFTGVEQHPYELNRTAARRAASLADAIGFARAHPEIYALPGDPAPVATAERCAVIDAALRLQLSENQVRNLASTADRARALLPDLWERAWEGFATLTQVEIGADLLSRFDEHDDTRAVFDTALAEAALTCSPGAFRAKARRLADRLAPAADPVLEHEAAFARRRLSIEPDQAGMSWVHLYTDTARARAIYRRATSTAKNMRKRARRGSLNDPRTRDQVRADLAAGWLTGAGSPTAVKTKVYVTVPADVLTETARASVRELPVPAGAPDLNEAARLDTGETIDRATAIRMLLEAGSFTRIITDPVTGVILDMDRRSRTATRHQREWLIQTHATCSRDGCTHAAAESDVDHWDPYNGPNRGLTDLSNLAPLCATENLDKQRTRFRYRRRPDGTVQLATPTGGSTRPPRPGEREAVELLARLRSRTARPLPDQPPF